MPKLDVVDLKNKKVGSVELADEVFGVEVNQALLYQAVHHFQAGQRAGTHKTKTRGEVSGSGRKLWRQKGTGRARIGSIRSPLWRHGGTVCRAVLLGPFQPLLRFANTTEERQKLRFVVQSFPVSLIASFLHTGHALKAVWIILL